MAKRITFFLKAGYRDDAKSETAKPDWIVDQEWTDLPIEILELFERTLHDAQGTLIDASAEALRQFGQGDGRPK